MKQLSLDERFSHEIEKEFEPGEVIFPEGEEGRELYLIQEGAVDIIKKTSIGNIKLAHFRKGDFFGDMALLQSIPRYASAIANCKTKLLILQPGSFLLKIRRDPTLAFEMLQQLSHRVKVSNERLIDALQSSGMSVEKIQNLLNSNDGLKS